MRGGISLVRQEGLWGQIDIVLLPSYMYLYLCTTVLDIFLPSMTAATAGAAVASTSGAPSGASRGARVQTTHTSTFTSFAANERDSRPASGVAVSSSSSSSSSSTSHSYGGSSVLPSPMATDHPPSSSLTASSAYPSPPRAANIRLTARPTTTHIRQEAAVAITAVAGGGPSVVKAAVTTTTSASSSAVCSSSAASRIITKRGCSNMGGGAAVTICAARRGSGNRSSGGGYIGPGSSCNSSSSSSHSTAVIAALSSSSSSSSSACVSVGVGSRNSMGDSSYAPPAATNSSSSSNCASCSCCSSSTSSSSSCCGSSSSSSSNTSSNRVAASSSTSSADNCNSSTSCSSSSSSNSSSAIIVGNITTTSSSSSSSSCSTNAISRNNNKSKSAMMSVGGDNTKASVLGGGAPVPVRRPYLEDVPEDVKCPICFDSAVSCQTTCSHFFCFACINSHINNRLRQQQIVSCPLCRTVIGTNKLIGIGAEKLARVRALRVACVGAVSGCTAAGSLEMMEQHEISCQHVLVFCSFREKGCITPLIRGEALQHENRCRFNPDVRCCCYHFSGCNVRGTEELLRPHEPRCRYRNMEKFVRCPHFKATGCGLFVRKKYRDRHAEFCPFELVKDLSLSSRQQQSQHCTSSSKGGTQNTGRSSSRMVSGHRSNIGSSSMGNSSSSTSSSSGSSSSSRVEDERRRGARTSDVVLKGRQGTADSAATSANSGCSSSSSSTSSSSSSSSSAPQELLSYTEGATCNTSSIPQCSNVAAEDVKRGHVQEKQSAAPGDGGGDSGGTCHDGHPSTEDIEEKKEDAGGACGVKRLRSCSSRSVAPAENHSSRSLRFSKDRHDRKNDRSESSGEAADSAAGEERAIEAEERKRGGPPAAFVAPALSCSSTSSSINSGSHKALGSTDSSRAGGGGTVAANTDDGGTCSNSSDSDSNGEIRTSTPEVYSFRLSFEWRNPEKKRLSFAELKKQLSTFLPNVASVSEGRSFGEFHAILVKTIHQRITRAELQEISCWRVCTCEAGCSLKMGSCVHPGRFLDAAVMGLFAMVLSALMLYMFGEFWNLSQDPRLSQWKLGFFMQKLFPFRRTFDFNLTHILLFTLCVLLLSIRTELSPYMSGEGNQHQHHVSEEQPQQRSPQAADAESSQRSKKSH